MLRGLLTAGLIAISIESSTAVAQAGSVRTARPNTWVKQHAYGLDAADLAAHPEWQLKDATNTPLYIGTRAAADFGNASFRAWWIAKAQAAVGAGPRTLFIDDVLMERRTTTSGGVARNVVDPRTGALMTDANWQKYMADFMVAVTAALPSSIEIVHDVLWYKGDSGDVLRELQAADAVSVDGGFNGANVTYGTGTYGWQTLASWVERQQARGITTTLDFSTSTAAPRLFGLASALLVNSGKAVIANDASTTPGAFWPGYDLDLGAPTSARYSVATGIWRRDYARGIVLVNEPLRSSRTISVPAGYRDLDGIDRPSVTLAGGQGTVLTPAPTPPPVAPVPTPVPPSDPATAPTAPAPPPTPAPPSKLTTKTRGGNSASIARVGGTAGAADPKTTRLSVRGSRTRLTGKVKGAVAGYVRVTIDKQRGAKWAFARRVTVSVKRNGTFVKDIPTLPSGSYRVSGSFEGTGTSKPCRSGYSTFG